MAFGSGLLRGNLTPEGRHLQTGVWRLRDKRNGNQPFFSLRRAASEILVTPLRRAFFLIQIQIIFFQKAFRRCFGRAKRRSKSARCISKFQGGRLSPSGAKAPFLATVCVAAKAATYKPAKLRNRLQSRHQTGQVAKQTPKPPPNRPSCETDSEAATYKPPSREKNSKAATYKPVKLRNRL